MPLAAAPRGPAPVLCSGPHLSGSPRRRPDCGGSHQRNGRPASPLAHAPGAQQQAGGRASTALLPGRRGQLARPGTGGRPGAGIVRRARPNQALAWPSPIEGFVAGPRGPLPQRCALLAACSHAELITRQVSGDQPGMDQASQADAAFWSRHPRLCCELPASEPGFAVIRQSAQGYHAPDLIGGASAAAPARGAREPRPISNQAVFRASAGRGSRLRPSSPPESPRIVRARPPALGWRTIRLAGTAITPSPQTYHASPRDTLVMNCAQAAKNGPLAVHPDKMAF